MIIIIRMGALDCSHKLHVAVRLQIKAVVLAQQGVGPLGYLPSLQFCEEAEPSCYAIKRWISLFVVVSIFFSFSFMPFDFRQKGSQHNPTGMFFHIKGCGGKEEEETS